MFRNYLLTALRNLTKRGTYSLINILGLSIGISSALIIFLFLQNELSFDSYHEKSDSIYRIWLNIDQTGRERKLAITSAPPGPTLAEVIPEIEEYVRFRPAMQKVLISFEDKQFYEEDLFYADPSVFKVFDFVAVYGDLQTALNEPNTIVLTESMAEKYFGSENPVGKVLNYNNQMSFTVTGVINDLRNTHMHFDCLVSFSTLNQLLGDRLQDWGNMTYFTYCQLQEGVSPVELEQKIFNAVIDLVGKDQAEMFRFRLMPLKDIHLKSDLQYEWDQTGEIQYIYIFSGIGIFIVLIACINFMNLSTARSVSRAREVGMRKVLGAQRPQLVFQFLGESMIFTVFSFLTAILITLTGIPLINNLLGMNLSMNIFNNSILILFMILLIFVIGIISGSYPSLFLSSFAPIKVLKGRFASDRSSSRIRKYLVIAQFSISITLIAGTGIIYKQMDFVRNKKLGFDKERVLIIPVSDHGFRDLFKSFRSELIQNSLISNVSSSSHVPGLQGSFNSFLPEGFHAEEVWSLGYLLVDYNFISTYGIETAEGRVFSRDFPTDASDAYVINETAVLKFGWENPVGKTIRRVTDIDAGKAVAFGKEGIVIGVVKDFHTTSLHNPIAPMVINLNEQSVNYVSVRFAPGNVREAVDFVREKWAEFNPGFPLEYSFTDSNFDLLYRSEEKMSALFISFTIFAIIIACLGLFGLASYTAEQRAKEIGIRKTLGATVPSLVMLLVKDFLVLVIISNIIALPAAYYFMNRWLQEFAFRASPGWSVFVYAAFTAIIAAVLTVSFQAVKAALTNPSQILRAE